MIKKQKPHVSVRIQLKTEPGRNWTETDGMETKRGGCVTSVRCYYGYRLFHTVSMVDCGVQYSLLKLY